ncbi:4-nitrophenyl phosphatase [Rhizoctonia solani]|uniref:4-nitrophenylphosphatase n=1 Tax=Rhizoctonia solani TaxID=456999 RepID=A0A8H8P537_9AGAM|nr:4-nitrophenyl phosphatase [Rhizoctonia solani]QRW25801.1 4-nitrophenyl phosphatase [Rhizoctonia solani]
MAAKPTTPSQLQAVVDSYDTFMFDCDGVLWHGDHLIPGIIEVLAYLRQQKKSIIFVTNNATKSRRSYKGKFDKLGVQAEVDEIFGSAYAAAVYLSSVIKLPKDKKVYVIGMKGLEEELEEEGISYIGGTDPADNTLNSFNLPFEPDPAVAAVRSNTSHATKGLLPGAGSISAPLRYSLKRDPVSTGKPHATMLDCVKAKHNYDPKKTLMIGDRLDTDIQFGKNGGLDTLLVLSGKRNTLIRYIRANASPVIPDYVVSSLGDFAVLAKGHSI